MDNVAVGQEDGMNKERMEAMEAQQTMAVPVSDAAIEWLPRHMNISSALSRVMGGEVPGLEDADENPLEGESAVEVKSVDAAKHTVTCQVDGKEVEVAIDQLYQELEGTCIEWIREKNSGKIAGDDGEEYIACGGDVIATGEKIVRPNSRVRFHGFWKDSEFGARNVTAPDGSPLTFEIEHEEFEDLPVCPKSLTQRMRGVVLEFKRVTGKGWILPISQQTQAITVKERHIHAKGKRILPDFAIVEFNVDCNPSPDGSSKPFATEIGAPSADGNSIEPIIFETGDVRKYLLKHGKLPEVKKIISGVIQKWNEEKMKGIILPDDHSKKLLVTEDNIQWGDGFERKIKLWTKVKFCPSVSQKGTRLATEVRKFEGGPLGEDPQLKAVGTMYVKVPKNPAPAPPMDLGPVHEGVVGYWNETEGFGYIEKADGGDLYVHASVIQTDGYKGLSPSDKVNFFIKKDDERGTVAYHVTAPNNMMYYVPEMLDKSKLDPVKAGLFRCDVCGINLSSQVTLDTHLAGRNHKKKLEKIQLLNSLPPERLAEMKREEEEKKRAKESIIYVDPASPFFCAYCIVELGSKADFRNHLRTTSHKHQERLHGGRVVTVLPHLPAGYMYRCKVCDKKMITGENWNKHVRGKQHKQKASMARIKYTRCELCDIEFTHPDQMEAHFISKRHYSAVNRNDGYDPHEDWAEDEYEDLYEDYPPMKRMRMDAMGAWADPYGADPYGGGYGAGAMAAAYGFGAGGAGAAAGAEGADAWAGGW